MVTKLRLVPECRRGAASEHVQRIPGQVSQRGINVLGDEALLQDALFEGISSYPGKILRNAAERGEPTSAGPFCD